MRLLVLSDRYPPQYEGAYELNCEAVVNGLVARGHEATVLTTTYGVPGKAREGQVLRLLRHHVFGQTGMRRRLAQLDFRAVAVENYRTTRQIAEQARPDLAFVWQMMSTSMLPVLAAQDVGLPTVLRLDGEWLINFHEWYVNEPVPYKRWFRAAMNGFRHFEELRLDHLIMAGEMLRDAHRRAGINVDGSVTILAAVPDEWIAAEPPPRATDGRLRLLYAGRLTASKGVHVAIEALRRLVHEEHLHGVALDIVGRGDDAYARALGEAIAAQGLQGHVRLHGFMPREELIGAYREHDLLLLPTLGKEGLPVAMLEALAQGLPVLASDVTGPQDVIEHGQNGLLVPPNDPAALAQAIAGLAASPEQRTAMGRAGIATIRRNHTMKRMIDQYEQFLQSCLAPHIKAAPGCQGANERCAHRYQT